MTTAIAPKEVKGDAAPRVYHWTVDALYNAIDAGVFQEPKRLELIYGRIIEKMPPSPQHVSRRSQAARLVRTMLGSGFYVVEEAPIHIAFDGEPIPDVLALRGAASDYFERHAVPDDVVLLTEIAKPSSDYDLGEKALLYARASISEYWVILLESQQIAVHREPAPDGYQVITWLGLDAQVSPLVASDATLSVRDFLEIAPVQD